MPLLGSIEFWNTKNGEEGYTTRPLSRYADQMRKWAYGLVVAARKQGDMLVWQAGESGLESGMLQCFGGTAYAQGRWPALRRGGAGACWACKPDLEYFKWWGRWQFTALAPSVRSARLIPAVIAPTIFLTWDGVQCPSKEPSRVGVASIWGRAMYTEMANVAEILTRKKCRAPRPARRGAPAAGPASKRHPKIRTITCI